MSNQLNLIEAGLRQGAGQVARTPDDMTLQDALRLSDLIGQRFKAHRLERLVEAVLRGHGFFAARTPLGADGGVDILAGSGLFGFDAPRIAVQVKSSGHPVDITAVRELQGAMRQFGADVGLFVARGGFRGVAPRAARRDFFQIRLWDGCELARNVVRVYESLPDDIQAELPLRRRWALAEDVATPCPTQPSPLWRESPVQPA